MFTRHVIINSIVQDQDRIGLRAFARLSRPCETQGWACPSFYAKGLPAVCGAWLAMMCAWSCRNGVSGRLGWPPAPAGPGNYLLFLSPRIDDFGARGQLGASCCRQQGSVRGLMDAPWPRTKPDMHAHHAAFLPFFPLTGSIATPHTTNHTPNDRHRAMAGADSHMRGPWGLQSAPTQQAVRSIGSSAHRLTAE